MIDWLWLVLKWLTIAVAVSPIFLGIGWAVVEGFILPSRIPSKEIEAMADDVMRNHPSDREEWAFMEEHAAWHRSHSFEQGKWRRVRKLIRRRLSHGGRPHAA